MTFISYAQNYEDVILWRALKHIEHGFYIDVGAAWPDEHSVTKGFYERGWHGINIEPNPAFHRQLEVRRPLDRNVQLAVSDREGTLTMNFLHNTGLSTLDEAIAAKHQQAGWQVNRELVQVTTLADICNRYLSDGQDVHFLKVDVEGLEDAVLRGNDWSKYRPWVVVAEATLPMSQVESHQAWEPILLEANYQFAYADGLNRFYVAQEHSELLPAFKYPPSEFDAFKLSAQQEAEDRAAEAEDLVSQAEKRAMQAEVRALQAESRASQAEERADELQVALDNARKELHELHQSNHHHRQLCEILKQHNHLLLHSRSWRITAPLRRIGGGLRRQSPGAWRSRVKMLVQHAVLYVRERPRLKQVALMVLNRFPKLKSRLSRGIYTQMAAASPPASEVPAELAQLTPRARQIYADLKAAVERYGREGY